LNTFTGNKLRPALLTLSTEKTINIENVRIHLQRGRQMFITIMVMMMIIIIIIIIIINIVETKIIKSRRKRWAGHVARMGKKKNVHRLLVGKPEGKRPLGRPRRGWINNNKIDLLEIELSVVDRIGLAQDRYR
jgi:hypothetical protein